MLELSSSNIILHQFHVNNDKGELDIGYVTIIGRDLMVQLGLMDNFRYPVFQWDGSEVPMKEPISLLEQDNLTGREMREVVIQTAEPVSKR